MDGRQQRTLKKMAAIKQAALALFIAHGVERVSMEEIAAEAHVSKVTIYNYFGSKDALYAQVLDLYIEETLAAAEAILNSEQNFLEKLKAIMMLQIEVTQALDFERLFEIWEANPAMGPQERLQDKVRDFIYRFFAEGRRDGFIDEHLSFDLLYLYVEIFRTGLKAIVFDANPAGIDQDQLEALYDLYFYGFIRRGQR